MSKKTEVLPDVVITLRLPSQGGIARTGTITVQRGDLARMGTFEYQSVGDVADAMSIFMEELIALEASPPPDITTKPGDEYKPTFKQHAAVSTKDGDGVITEIVPMTEGEGDDAKTTLSYMVLIDGQTEPEAYGMGDLTLKAAAPKSAAATSDTDPATVKSKPKAADQRLPTDTASGKQNVAQLQLF